MKVCRYLTSAAILVATTLAFPAAKSSVTTTVTGIWRAAITDKTSTRTVLMQLHQRATGEVMGYWLGGSSSTTVTSGLFDGSTLNVSIEAKDPSNTTAINLAGKVTGDTWATTMQIGSSKQLVTFTRIRNVVLQERKFTFVHNTSSGISYIELGVVTDDSGNFIAGGFSGKKNCNLFACAGWLTSFSNSNGVISIGLHSGGNCSGDGTLTASFDTTTMGYSGNYRYSNCVHTDSGQLQGGQGVWARTDDIESILASLGKLADDLQSRNAFTNAHPSLSPVYLHSGKTLTNLVSELNAEVAAYSLIKVSFTRFSEMNTVENPDMYPLLKAPLGMIFHDKRSGLPHRGGAAVIYQDIDTTSPNDDLSIFVHQVNGWTIHGNQLMTSGLAFPDIGSFTTNPSDQFILDAAGMSMALNARPYCGADTPCAHQGAHIVFKSMGSSYTVNIYAPADAVVHRTASCTMAGGFAKYELSLAFASDISTDHTFEFSFEPAFSADLCTTNPDFFKQFILVSAGDSVRKGQLIARMYLDSTALGHIHFHLGNVDPLKGDGTFHCPNIFTRNISAAFESLIGAENCAGTAFSKGSGLCYQPAEGEDLTGL